MGYLPENRGQLIDYIKANLGEPFATVNVSDTQINQRIDEAFQWWKDYHFDGSQRVYWVYQIQPSDLVDKFIAVPPDVLGITKIFPMYSTVYGTAGDLFDTRFQIAQSDLFRGGTSFDMSGYVFTMHYIEMIDQFFNTTIGVNFNRHSGKLYPEVTWNHLTAGDYMMIECYKELDPDTYPLVWQDRWLMQFASALVKRQWGQNLKKFGDVQLPGGVKLNGQEMYDEAQEEIKMMKEEMIESYSLPPTGYMA
jgi:hypothetical protein